jgi:hypothetical protein
MTCRAQLSSINGQHYTSTHLKPSTQNFNLHILFLLVHPFTMKFSVPTLFTAAACFLATAEAFVPNRIARKHSPFRVSSRTAMAIETSDFGSAMPEAASYMEQLGIEEGKLALGIDPIDVYSHIGR